jgi:hypothetical protein
MVSVNLYAYQGGAVYIHLRIQAVMILLHTTLLQVVSVNPYAYQSDAVYPYRWMWILDRTQGGMSS